MHRWAQRAFLKQQPPESTARTGLDLRRQDHGIFGRGRSSRDTTPLRLGTTTYTRGLGTHSVSEIRVLTGRPHAVFSAQAGIDNNWDTAARHGSVVFVVEAAGREVLRSPVRRGSDGPMPVRVELGTATEFTLHVLDAGDGPSHDQADWADARLDFPDGTHLYLDDLPPLQPALGTSRPFSFTYDGRPAAALLDRWQVRQEKSAATDNTTRYTTTWTDPDSGLEVRCELTAYADAPAVDWVLWFHNAGTTDTPVLENIMPLDLDVLAGHSPATVHTANGSTAEPTDFQPLEHGLRPDTAWQTGPRGGRSSNGAFPFFNLAWGDEGLMAAVGWSGQWTCGARRNREGTIRLSAGQARTRLILRPGERLRTPRILLLYWWGARLTGHNRLRRLIYDHCTPLLAGRKPLPPVQCNSWFPVNTGVNANEENQIQLLRAYQPLGIEYLVMDAGWYGTGRDAWPNQVGTWTPRPDAFPRGLQPIGQTARETGIRFGMWFEPERIRAGTQLEREHPNWMITLDNNPNRLLNLGLPEAQAWLIGLISDYVERVPLGYYRQDFNMDPLPYWQNNDAENRIGITENLYIQGLYKIWDALIERFPNLLIEGCASGGRRMDLESLSRCHTYWRSDHYFDPIANRAHIQGASLYIPGNYLNTPLRHLGNNPHHLYSIVGGALCLAWDPRETAFDQHTARAWISQFKALRHLAVNDFYPLLPHSTETTQWTGHQLHDPKTQTGVAILFRPRNCPYTGVQVALHALDPNATYHLQWLDGKTTETRPGHTLIEGLQITMPAGPASTGFTYAPAQPPVQETTDHD